MRWRSRVSLRTLFILLTFGILKVLSLRRRFPGHVCLKLPEWCVETINTTCLTKMNPEAHYHRLIDCLVPEYLALKKAATSTACVIGCGSRCEYLRYLVVLNEEKIKLGSSRTRTNTAQIPMRSLFTNQEQKTWIFRLACKGQHC